MSFKSTTLSILRLYRLKIIYESMNLYFYRTTTTSFTTITTHNIITKLQVYGMTSVETLPNTLLCMSTLAVMGDGMCIL